MREKVVFNAEDWKTVLPLNPADRNHWAGSISMMAFASPGVIQGANL